MSRLPRRRLTRRLGTLLIVLGVALCAYAVAVLAWRDPVTDVYTAYQQRGLRAGLERESERWARLAADQAKDRAAREVAAARAAQRQQRQEARRTLAAERASARADVRGLARRFARETVGDDGAPLGRIQVPRIGLSTVVVEGTDDWDSLSKGPGRFERTSFPGLGRTVAIAGHRTTFSAPFRHIDELRTGDAITLRLPYATFSYRVVRHRIVDDSDWSIVRDVGHDQLVLSACHPLYRATQRYVIFARLQSFELAGGGGRVPV